MKFAITNNIKNVSEILIAIVTGLMKVDMTKIIRRLKQTLQNIILHPISILHEGDHFQEAII